MAIFRAGKRVGPFDIRAGFPRDRSLENVDRDPRLKQRANTENTIGRFRSMMARAGGYARPARFVVRINLPRNLEKLNAPSQISGGDSSNPDAVMMQQISNQLGQQVNMHCDTVSMPGHDLQAETITQFGPSRQMVTGHAFTGTIGASFYADKYLRERHFFELWQKMATNMVTHKAGYYDDYIGSMQILQLGSLDGEGDRDVPTYGIEATEVYPATISAIEYNYASANQIVKINVEFQYKEWHNLTTEGVKSMSFGASQQTLHDIKQANTGLFGKLPPELQRAGHDVFNSAKTQFNPIGKIFGGRVFPPFF